MRRFYPVLFFALVTVLAFWKVIFHRDFTLLVGSDTALAYFPWFDVAAYWLKKGVFLLWDPYVYAGKPSMGESQPGLFYPLNWLFMLLPARSGGMSLDGLQALFILDYFLAGFFFYKLARSMNLTPSGAALAGIAWAFGGYTNEIYGYVNVLSGFVWLPLTFLFFRRGLLCPSLRPRLRSLLISGIFLALSFLPGHHIPPIHIAFLLLLYTIFIELPAWRNRGWRAGISGVVSLGIVAAAAMLLTAIQWIPSAEWARRVYRWIGDGPPIKWGQSVPYSALERGGNLSPQDAVSLLLPYVSTNANIYTGIGVLFLAVVGILFAKGRDSRFFTLAVFVYLLLSWGSFSAVHGWANTFIPGVWFAREVFFYLVLFQACLALLAGFGLDHIVESYRLGPNPRLLEFIRRAGWTVAGLVILSGVLMAMLHLYQGMPMNHPYFLSVGGLVTFGSIMGLLLYMVHTARIQPSTFGFFILALVLVDLSSNLSKRAPHRVSSNDPGQGYVGEIWKRRPAVDFLVSERKRSYFRGEDSGNAFPVNFGDVWRLDSTMGHGATALVGYFDFRATGWGPGSNASSLLNGRFYVGQNTIPGFAKILSDGAISIYENPRAVPRAFIATRYRVFSSDKKMLAWIPTPLLAPRETVLLKEDDVRKLPREFIEVAVNEDDGIDVEVLSRWRQAERGADRLTDEGARQRAYIYHAPWGWSVGDELSLALRPKSVSSHAYLIVNYIPTRSETAVLPVHIEDSTGKRELTLELPGLPSGEAEPDAPRQGVVDLGPLGRGECRLFVSKGPDCTANIDSVRISTSMPDPEGSAGDVSVDSITPNCITLTATLRRASFVVLSEVYYPGWEAKVDGVASPVLQADYILRAVPVQAGKHSLELRFRPRPFVWGMIVSLLSAALITILLISLR